MLLNIVVTPAALSDLKESADWYDLQQPGLGDKFLHCINDKFSVLIITPGIGSIRFDIVRCTTVDIFSHIIYYTFTDSLITIIRVLHSSRKPLWE